VSMKRSFRAAILALTAIVMASGTAQAVSPAERCEAYQLAASGQRISAKLHCRAWAKLTGTEVDASCLDKAEKRFLLQLQEGGADCATPSEVVSLGAAADAQTNAVVADIQTDSPTIPDLTGTWTTRSSIAFNPSGGPVVGCEYYLPAPCPEPNIFLIIDCRTKITQTGNELHYDSECSTPPESPTQRETFQQEGTGPIDRVTGEWMLTGTVNVPGLQPIDYEGEGVFSADGRSQTGFTTAGFSAGGFTAEWLATTVGHRVD
jgi:hypothetical protein